MGSEYTTTNWIRYFSSVEAAKIAAEEDYAKGKMFFRHFKWKHRGNRWYSGDLGYVSYTIAKIKVEE